MNERDRRLGMASSARPAKGARFRSFRALHPREEYPDEVMISWFERPQGSPAEYENAQKRILEVFGQ